MWISKKKLNNLMDELLRAQKSYQSATARFMTQQKDIEYLTEEVKKLKSEKRHKAEKEKVVDVKEINTQVKRKAKRYASKSDTKKD